MLRSSLNRENRSFVGTMSSRTTTAVLTCLAACVWAGTSPAYKYKSECVVWDEVITSLMNEENVNLKCNKNAECSGIDCSGKYTYSGPLSFLSDFGVQFCFGMVLEPCDHPVSLKGYIEVFDENNRTETTSFVIQNETDKKIEIQGTHYNVTGVEIGGYLDIHMNHTDIQKRKHLYLQVEMKMRWKALHYESTPNGAGVTIIPKMYVAVPACDTRVSNHTHASGTCSFQALPAKAPRSREGPATACVDNSMEWCGTGQLCEKGHCWCMYRYTYDQASNTCIKPKSTGAPPKLFDAPAAEGDAGDAGPSKTIIIISTCSVAGFFVISAIVVALVMKYKRHRQRYGQHELLLSNEEAEDPDVDLDT